MVLSKQKRVYQPPFEQNTCYKDVNYKKNISEKTQSITVSRSLLNNLGLKDKLKK